MIGHTRRHFVNAASAALTAQTAARPNVLVVMSDQESQLLPGPVHLPNRQRLTARGVSFQFAFCNTPQCSPARGAMLTGLDPHRAGVLTNVDAGSIGKPLDPKLPAIGSVFQKAGYATGYFGKWHLGGAKADRKAYGFAYSSEGNDEQDAEQAAQWIRNQKQPWLCWVSLLNPHNIYEGTGRLKEVAPRPGILPPASGLSNLQGKPAEQQQYVDHDQGKQTRGFTAAEWIRYRSLYCELVEKVDGQLGKVLDAVRAWDDTIVVYTSDHGDALGEHGLPFKGPFMYEELIRIPLVISGPGSSGLSSRRSDLVTQTDLAPTLASMAGIAWPGKTTGFDLTQPGRAREGVYLEYYAKQKWVNPIRTIRTRQYKLNWYDRGNKEVYDLKNDPHELRNLAGRPEVREQQKRLEASLSAWRKPIL